MLSQKHYIYVKYLTKTQTTAWWQPEEKGYGVKWRQPKGEEWGQKRDFAQGDGHTMQCADDVLLSCTLKTCMVL